MQGRYHLLRLHPLSVAELGLETPDELRDLLTLGGFPEPFLGGSEREARRWSRAHRTLLIRDEVASLERVQDLGALEDLMLRLPALVGSPLSVNALREDLQVSHKTAAAWLQIFERLDAIVRLPPFGAPRIRAVKKERKHYHFDWSVVPSDAARFENLVAGHLLKWVHYQQDAEGRDIELRYFRDTDGREVDFVIVDGSRPVRCVECKPTPRSTRVCATSRSDSRIAMRGRFRPPARSTKDYASPDDIRVAPARALLKTLI